MIKHNFEKILYLTVICLTMACTAENKSAIAPLENGQVSIHMENMEFLIDPAIGARIVSAKLMNKEILLQEREELLNFGATLWPAPQSIWNWPPPHAFQFDNYAVEITADSLVLKSEPDPKLGLEVMKTFIPNTEKKCLEIIYQISNKASDTVAVGPWEIVCVPASGAKVFFPMGATPSHVDTTFTFENHDGIGWFEYAPERLVENQKLFNYASEGWLAHINMEGVVFVKTFDKIPAENLAPGQGNVEVYVSKSFEYIELENHGEYVHLAPNESLKYRVQWFLMQLPDSVSGKGYSPELIALIRKIIQ